MSPTALDDENECQHAALHSALASVVREGDIQRLNPILEDLRRIKDDSVYAHLRDDIVAQARQHRQTEIMSYFSEKKPFQFTRHSAYMEVMRIVHGIEDEDWNEQYGLERFDSMLRRGWDVNDKARASLPFSLTHFLLINSYNPNEIFQSHTTPIYLAAHHRWPAQARDLLVHGASLSFSPTSPLHAAALNNDVKMMALLLDNGAAIDRLAEKRIPRGGSRRNEDKVHRATALHIAVQKGCLGSVRFLLGRGADPTVRSSLGGVAWEWIPEGPEQRECRELVRISAEGWSVVGLE